MIVFKDRLDLYHAKKPLLLVSSVVDIECYMRLVRCDVAVVVDDNE